MIEDQISKKKLESPEKLKNLAADFSAYKILQKKSQGETLSNQEIKWFINGLLTGEIADYQMTALLMAIHINGLDAEETSALTDAMLYSGEVLHFPEQHVIDKHSTGGVGDKTSFILAPIAAACGVKIPMISGRGLGHTGGTTDKIESIPGFKTALSIEKFKEILNKNNLVLMGQTKDIAPADKIIYGLRDVTATIDCIPLITASIMSKKLAEGASGIVMDIKTGQGAFLTTLSRARKLAKSLQDTALRFNKNIMTMITDMSEPLGMAVGNSLEIIESIETLRGNGPKDLTKVSVELAGGMIHIAGLAKTHKAGIKMAKEALKNGTALEKFRELIQGQEGDSSYVDDYSKFDVAEEKTPVISTKDGYVTFMDTKNIGLHCVKLGGGRAVKEDIIDPGVGFIFHKKIGHKVKKGESILTIYHRANQKETVLNLIKSFTEKDIKIKPKLPLKKRPLIYETAIKWSYN
ncbi:thymidine phosphorylase [Bacteriovoracales bacterium]|nr:thymidine phosphorylase [Bacteriovoracales bacterium]